MEDLNKFINAFADLVADKVVAKMQVGTVQSWPDTETKEEEIPEVAKAEREEREPVEVKVVSHDYDARRVALSKVDVRTLRNRLSEADGSDGGVYAALKKPEVIEKIIDFEKLIGHTIDEEIESKSAIPDDNDLSEPEPENDDESVELTREVALELDLPKLREVAATRGYTADDWKGLDVDALVAVIFGDEPPEVDTEEEGGYTEDEIRAMSLSELKELAQQVIDQGGEIEYDRNTGREELSDKIVELVF